MDGSDSDNDSDGEQSRMSNNYLQSLVQYGTFYDPANTHYGHTGEISYVSCDRCSRQGILECLAYPNTNEDVCIACAVRFVVDTHCMGSTVADALLRVQEMTQFAVCNNDPSKAGEWTAIMLRTDGVGRVCGGYSGLLTARAGAGVAAAAEAAAPNENDGGFALEFDGADGVLDDDSVDDDSDDDDSDDDDSDDDEVTHPEPLADANTGAGFASVVTTNPVLAVDVDE